MKPRTDLPGGGPPGNATVKAALSTEGPEFQRPTTSGLGRGLAGILSAGPVIDHLGEDRGLVHLFGPADRVGTPTPLAGVEVETNEDRLRRYVADVAFAAIAEAFALSGLVLVGAGVGSEPALLAARLPPAINAGSPLLFAIYGRLWSAVDGSGLADRSPETGPLLLAGEQVLVRPLRSIGEGESRRHMAVAAVRCEPLSPAETDAFMRSVSAVAAVLGEGPQGSESLGTIEVATSAQANLWAARVVIGGSSVGHGYGSRPAAAIANAAAAAIGYRGRVLFAGASDIGGITVSVVIVGDEAGTPVVGLSVRPGDDKIGPVLAFLSAANKSSDS